MHLHLKELAEQKAMTTAKLAEVSGLSVSTINHILASPGRNTRTSTVIALAYTIELKVYRLFS